MKQKILVLVLTVVDVIATLVWQQLDYADWSSRGWLVIIAASVICFFAVDAIIETNRE